MKKLNWIRLLLGGAVAGVIAAILEFLVDGLWLQDQWSDTMLSFGRNEFSTRQSGGFMVVAFLLGFAAILIYVAFRRLFGANWKTAIYAGLIAWAVGVLLPNASHMLVTDLVSKHIALYTTFGGLVEVVAGTVAGAFLYKEA